MTLEEITQVIQTADDLADAREALGLSLADLAKLLRMNGSQAARHLREMEAGTRAVGGTVAAAVGLLLEVDDQNEEL